MPRDGSNHYQVPPGSDAVADYTADSARYNGFIHDVETDLNAPRPIVAGGTGATTAYNAMVNLNGEIAYQHVTNYDAMTFQNGSFYSDSSATASPFDGHAFVGTAILYGGDNSNVVLHAFDLNGNNAEYWRRRTSSGWAAWTGPTWAGDLTISKANPTIALDKNAAGQGASIFGTYSGSQRWQLVLGGATAESGGNAGSDFQVNRYSDAGAYLGTPFLISRTDGRILGNGLAPTSTAELANKAYVDSAAAAATATFLPLAGGTVTGPLNVSNITASSSPTTGALQTAGGLGVGGAVNVGGAIAAAGNINGSGAIQAAGGVYYFQDGGKYLQWTSAINGFVFVGGNLQVNNGSITVTTGNFIAANGMMEIRATAGGDANLVLEDSGGAGKGYFQWNHTDNSLRLILASATEQFIINNAGVISTMNGLKGKAGQAGVPDVNAHNFYWNTSVNQMWIDNTNLGTVAVTCDYRTKKDIAPLASTWEVIKRLRPIVYTQREYTPPGAERPLFSNDDIWRWGFIAHELQETLLPSAANGVKDAPNEIQSPNLLMIVAALTKALQEAMERIEALEQK